MEIVLGTAQWGMAYGIAGRGRAADDTQVRSILDIAASFGVTRLDTAQAYGDIEVRLASLLARSAPWRVTTKILAPAPDLAPHEAAAWVEGAVALSWARLGDRLEAVLMHDVSVLDDASRGAAVWGAFERACVSRGLRPGVSLYAPADLIRLSAAWGLRQAQLPANVFDQRVRDSPRSSGVVRHLRSVFLQGLLLNDSVAARLPAAAEPLRRWQAWCRERRLAPACAALSIARGLDPGAEGIVVGVESAEQLDGVLKAWAASTPLSASMLRCDDPRVIDPRQWTIAA